MSSHDVPPPYSETASSPQPPSSVPHIAAYLTAYLHALPSQVAAAGAAHRGAQAARDLELLALLAPLIEAFLADAAERYPPPALAELTLVPEAAAPAPWAPSGAADRRRDGVLVQLARVAAPAAGDEKKGAARNAKTSTAGASEGERDWGSALFDEWGRFDGDEGGGAASEGGAAWWWADEAMARRLAGHLNPRMGEGATASRGVERVAVAEEARSGWGWGKRKGAEPRPAAAAAAGRADVEERHAISMAVRADEVTFRRENNFGVWESMTGWGIVVTLRFRRS